MISDFTALKRAIASGCITPAQALAHSQLRMASPACQHAYTQMATADVWARAAQQPLHLPLAGVNVSVKALFDVSGWVTHAGSQLLAQAPCAQADAPAVARLRAAGACIAGQTHMVEFAFSGVGTNPHYRTPAAWDGLWGQALPDVFVPGGSSSGTAVSVATGSAWLGLGSDTGGSIRIPAALNGVVGFKSTSHRVPLAGAIPLSTTLDTACAMTRSVRDALAAHQILAQRRVTRSSAPLSAWRLAVPRTTMLEALAPAVATSFTRSLALLRQAGAAITEIDLPELAELAQINAAGTFSAAESFAWHRTYLSQAAHAQTYDPRVRQRIEAGARIGAADYIALQRARQRWIAQVEAAIAGFDALLSPTTAITAPRLADVAPATGQDAAQDAQRDAAFFTANALLLRNTSVVNMLDGCAISLPCHLPGELPMGLMLWHGRDRDDAVLALGQLVETCLLEYAHRQGAQRWAPLDSSVCTQEAPSCT